MKQVTNTTIKHTIRLSQTELRKVVAQWLEAYHGYVNVPLSSIEFNSGSGLNWQYPTTCNITITRKLRPVHQPHNPLFAKYGD